MRFTPVLSFWVISSLVVSGSGLTGASDGPGNGAECNDATVSQVRYAQLPLTSTNLVTSKASLTDVGFAPRTGASHKFAAQQKIDSGTYLKGLNPAVDIRAYGARSISPAPSTTAAARAGSRSVTLANGSQFLNGDTIRIDAAGSATTLTTPTGVTVTPSVNAGGSPVAPSSVKGATSYSYKIIACDKRGGCTAASTIATTTIGAATLGRVTANISTIDLSGQTMIVHTTSPHGFSTNSLVIIQYFSTQTPLFEGFWIINSTPTSTSFTCKVGFDSRVVGTPKSDSSGGTAISFNANTVTWTPVTNAWKYYIYGRSGGAFKLIGTSYPTEAFFNDYGSPIMDNQTFPTFVPTTAPASATPQYLVTTISSGGGTNGITIVNATTSAVSGTTVLFGNDTAFLSAMSAAGNGGRVYIPAGIWPMAGYITQPVSRIVIEQFGTIAFEDTFATKNVYWYGIGGYVLPAFGWNTLPAIQTHHAYPIIYQSVGSSSSVIKHLGIGSFMNNGALNIYNDAAAETSFEEVAMSTNPGNTQDYIGQMMRVRSGGFSYRFSKTVFLGGQAPNGNEGDIGFSFLPAIVFTPNAGTATGNFGFKQCWFIGRSGVEENHSNSTNGVGFDLMEDIQTQNMDIPLLISSSYPTVNVGFGGVNLENISPADYPTAVVANLSAGGTGGTVKLTNLSNLPQGGHSVFTGGPLSIYVEGTGGVSFSNVTPASDATGSGNASLTGLGVQTNGTATIGYQMGLPSAPTAVAVTGGSLAPGTYYYRIMAIDANGNTTGASPATVTPCITSGGNLSCRVSWTSLPGQIGTRLCRGRAANNTPCASDPGNSPASYSVRGTSVIDTGVGDSFTASSPNVNMASSAVLGPEGVAAQSVKITGGGFVSTLTLNSFSANRAQTLPDVNGIVPVTSYLNSAYDSFNRSNGVLGSNWTSYLPGGVFTPPSINSNAIQNTASNQAMAAFWSASLFANDQFAEFSVITSNGSGPVFSPAVRFTSSGGYECAFKSGIHNATGIYKTTGTSSMLLSEGVTQTVTPGDVLRCEIQGTTITQYYNGAALQTASDTTYTAGSPGFVNYSNAAAASVSIHNWSGGNLHPITHSDVEQDWTKLQHFTRGLALGSETVTSSPRSEQNVFLPGALTSTWTGATWTTDRAVIITRIQVQAKTAPTGCTTDAAVRLTDGTTSVNVTISTAANDSGAISQSYAAGASLQVKLQTAAAGCTTSPADANVSVQYRMQ
jgi:hypothetical protein